MAVAQTLSKQVAGAEVGARLGQGTWQWKEAVNSSRSGTSSRSSRSSGTSSSSTPGWGTGCACVRACMRVCMYIYLQVDQKHCVSVIVQTHTVPKQAVAAHREVFKHCVWISDSTKARQSWKTMAGPSRLQAHVGIDPSGSKENPSIGSKGDPSIGSKGGPSIGSKGIP